MRSSTASSPSVNRYIAPRSPEADQDIAAAAARFNPLFIHTANAVQPHNHTHRYNRNHSLSHNPTKHNHSLNHNSTNHNLSQNISHSISDSSFATVEHSSISHSKLTANTSSSSMQAGAPTIPSRKVHVVYYLSRSGQLEHPHLLEVSIPPNQGLYLRDVKRRLSVIRGKRLPSTFAWSYKRSYKNGYVWQDLCDDDLIFPAHGCEYVLKGSEILNDQRSTAAQEECEPNGANADAGPGTHSNGTKEEQGHSIRDPKVAYYDESMRAVSPASLHVSMVDSGTDAATQTEEELRPATDDDSTDQAEASKSLYFKHQGLVSTKHSFSPHRGSCTTSRPQNAVELNKAEIASPPSSSATNSPSPYQEIASTSSSSTSGFNMATDCRSVGESSSDHVKPAMESINPGSKTPGRPWMKKAIQKLEEQDEILCIHTADNGGESSVDGFLATDESASSKVKHRGIMAGNSVAAVIMECDQAEQSLAASAKPVRGRHSSALSLLQFMSCGGLDIKEQILPMSLYRLRSKGTPATANQLHMSNYVLSPEHFGAESFATGYGCSGESGKLWTKIGKPKSLCMNGTGSKPLFKVSGEFMNGESDMRSAGQRHYPQSMQANSLSSAANGSSTKVLGASIPDVISIGRSSISDRSTNVSHELEYQAVPGPVRARLKRSGDVVNNCNNVIKGSPQFMNARPEVVPDLRNNEGTRPALGTFVAKAVSGEILMSKGSPLFVPGKRHLSYSGTPLNYVGNNNNPLAPLISTSALQAHYDAGNNAMPAKHDTHKQSTCSSSSCNPSRAFSEGELSCMLANRNAWSKSGDQRLATINGYDQSMAQLWEELLAAPTSAMSEEHQQQDANFQRVRQVMMGGSSAWEVERTLQNAVELSLQPPLEHHLLHVDCPHCGRKVKAELMKAHVKSCSSPKSPSAKSISFGKSPKSDSNLCQRFLRASPPPTKL